MTQPIDDDQPGIETRAAQQHGIAFAARDTPAGQAWDGRFEHYLTDPAAEPDAARWQTDVAYLIAGRD